MVQSEILLSAHYGTDISGKVWEASAVGLKAQELATLPTDWTPPFAVIPAPLLVEVGSTAESLLRWLQTDVIRKTLSPLLRDAQQHLIVRSSGSVEHLESRGWLESKTCAASLYDIASATAIVVQNSARAFQKDSVESRRLAVIIQHYERPRLYGHLSNERRVTLRSNRWLCEIETSTTGRTQKLHWLTARLPKSVVRPGLLMCRDQKDLRGRLLEIAAASLSEKRRCHYEWIWDGERVWVVQRDVEVEECGTQPVSSVVPVRMSTRQPKLSVFVPATRASGAWKKTESLKVFADAGLPVANLYVLEDPKAVRALSDGRTPPHIKADLQRLLESPIVIRTDIQTEESSQALLSPRSETLDSVESALSWLKRTAAEIISKDIPSERFCFLAHRYITARSGAFSLARPDNPRVRIDSIWGLPDGLLCFPHDSFEVGADRRGHVERHIRCKPFYLASDERGAWTRRKCFVPWDWRASLTDDELTRIADQTRKVAVSLKRPVEVMFFVGVDTRSGYPPILPWIHVLDLPDKTEEPSDYYYAGRAFTVSNEIDLHRLREIIDREVERQKVYIKLHPSPDLLRSKEFVNLVADTASELRIPVQLEGSILSHIYYMLLRQNVRVRCTDPFVPSSKRRKFGKLVRDLVPITIQSRGEAARTVRVPKEVLGKLLKVKALEEAFELFWEEDPTKSFEEMADILEVIQSACKTYGRSFQDLVAVAEKKRNERGGFDKGIVLMETAHVPLIATSTEPSLLLEADEQEHRSELPTHAESKFLANAAISGQVRLRGKDVVIPLIPPHPEQAGRLLILPAGDDEHELLVTYTAKELLISLRKRPLPETPNQLLLPL